MRTHGVAGTYSWGCRCAECTEAWRAYYAAKGYNHRRRERLLAAGLTTNGTEWKDASRGAER